MFLMLHLSMADTVLALESHHALILEHVDFIHRRYHIYRDVKPKISSLQQILLNHFALQTKELYAALTEFFENDREKSKLLEFLIYDLKELKIKTLGFFDEHPADMGDTRAKKFIQEFENYSDHLVSRIHHEKKYLIPFLEEKSR